MFLGNTRAALLIENKDKNGNPQVLIYHLAEPITVTMEQERSTLFNIFDGAHMNQMPVRITVDGYLAGIGPQHWNGPMPDPEQAEIEPAQLAIVSNESEIVIDEEGFEEWQRE